MNKLKKVISALLLIAMILPVLPVVTAEAAARPGAWDGTVDISWYDPAQTEFFISTPAELAGLAALVNGMVDPNTPRIIGDETLLQNYAVHVLVAAMLLIRFIESH